MNSDIVSAIITAMGGIIGAIIGAWATRSKPGQENPSIQDKKKLPAWVWGILGALLGATIAFGILILSGYLPNPLFPDSYLSELEPRIAKVGWKNFSRGKYEFNSAEDGIEKGSPIVAHGVEYSHGLFAHALSRLVYDLNGNFSELTTKIMLVDWMECGDGAIFVIKLDGDEIYRSKKIFNSSDPVSVRVSVANSQQLELITETGETDNIDCDWTIWGNPILR
jgi:hypothetical protein